MLWLFCMLLVPFCEEERKRKMKKAFNVILVSRKSESVSAVEAKVKSLGTTAVLKTCEPHVYSIAVLPDDQSHNCSSIKNEVRTEIDIFYDQVMVVAIAKDNVSSINWEVPASLALEEEGETPMRNFQRFPSRHEAFLQWKKENPRWVYDDGINVAVQISVDDWAWLPVKEDGIYERRKYEKYILG